MTVLGDPSYKMYSIGAERKKIYGFSVKFRYIDYSNKVTDPSYFKDWKASLFDCVFFSFFNKREYSEANNEIILIKKKSV